MTAALSAKPIQRNKSKTFEELRRVARMCLFDYGAFILYVHIYIRY